MTLTPEDISELKALEMQIISMYSERDRLAKRYEEIYFLLNPEQPKGLKVDEKDIKTTISPSGRNDVTGLKRILDTAEIQIKIKKGNETWEHSDKIEKALKTMIRVSGESGMANVEKDENLSAVLFGMSVLTVESVDDLILSKTRDTEGKDKAGVNSFVLRQLEELKKRTPFLLKSVNPMQCYPEWGEYGMVGHVRKYSVRGNVLKERWGCTDPGIKIDLPYIVHDFHHYEKRLVYAEGVSGELYADTWLEPGDVAKLPIFMRYGGGSSLWHEPEKQLQPFLYAKAKGEWDKRENLFWTYLFTAIYMQGLPGPTIIRDPDDTSNVKVEYDKGVKIITMKGKLERNPIIDGDVIQIKNLLDAENSRSTIQPEAFGGGADATFSGYVMSMNASKLPTEDPKEGIAKVYRDACLYILQRIKAESIPNELISAQDIPDDVELEVTLEPNLTQDDLRNAQVVTNLKTANTNISDEWMNTNILKIADSQGMFKQKTKEDMRKAIVLQILQNPQLMQPMIMAAMGQKAAPPKTPPSASELPAEMSQDAGMGEGGPDIARDTSQPATPPGGEAMPKTDAMIPQGQRQ